MNRKENYISKSIVLDIYNLSSKYLISFSVVLNFILNVIYVRYICYNGYTQYIGWVLLVLSFVWSVISFITSYKLDTRIGNLLFALNIFLTLFLSKLWFIYI